MNTKKPDIQADILTHIDRGETPSLMEPLTISAAMPIYGELRDRAAALLARSTGFRRSLPPGFQTALADIVRSMNCYYSNLIEGHNTHPIAIEQALAGHYSTDKQKRCLQLEAKAHITVQAWIDAEGIATGTWYTPSTLCEIHRRFCELLPEDLLWLRDTDDKLLRQLIPGQLRDQDVIVGRHIAISPAAVPRFLARYQAAYEKLNHIDLIVALAASHHRLLWIHPFLDGNGRVARLLLHAIMRELLETAGLWSVSRGLARQVKTYKAHLSDCDAPRQNDFDGRGTLSQDALIQFTIFFMETCLDQIDFMETLMEPRLFSTRVLQWVKEEIECARLPKQAMPVFEILLVQGEITRGEIAKRLQLSDRQARRITAALIKTGAVQSRSSRAPLKLAFPAKLIGRWMPGLFPE